MGEGGAVIKQLEYDQCTRAVPSIRYGTAGEAVAAIADQRGYPRINRYLHGVTVAPQPAGCGCPESYRCK